jgi:energy-coupling factor transporter ATP-binding protein EcfA2
MSLRSSTESIAIPVRVGVGSRAVTIPDLQGALWAWVQTLPAWQSDLLRRLTTLDDIAEADLDGATRMVLAAHGIADAGGSDPAPIPALVGPAEHRTVGVLAMKDLVAVGSVEHGQRLEFATEGLTVVYGETGSGKSSYARVLRKACRSSAKPIEILPNVLNAGPGAGKSRAGTAQIDVAIDGATSVLTRDVNAPPERDLAEVSVFDSDCADVYADEESEITYTPSALRLFERLVALQAQIRKRIEDEIATLIALPIPTDGFDPSTKAGALAGALNENVNPATVAKLADVSPEELVKLEDLRGKVTAAKVNDPARTAAQLDKRADAIDELATTLEQRASRVDERAVADLLAVNGEIERLSTTADELARIISQTSTFPVGGPGWRAMWTAAQAYVRSLADSGLVFPPGTAAKDAHCPLCQQALTPEALLRLDRFEEHARGQVQKALDAARLEQKHRIDDVAAAATEARRSAQVGAVLDDAVVEAAVVAFNDGIRYRAEAIARTGTAAAIDAPALPPSPIAPLRDLGVVVRRSAAEQRALATPDSIAKAAREIAELDNRLLLAMRRDLVLARIEALKRVAKLKQAFSALATTGLSKRIGEFTETAVTEQLRARLAAELNALGGDHIPVMIGARGAKGKTKVSLRLDASRKVDVGDVLSEGERRAVALAFFLAEVAVAEHGGGIVLDDPVSSLDHNRRSYVAKRLVEESSRRQVIVFTHDVVFLLELQDQARLAARPCETRVVRRVGASSGIASKDLPWVAQNVKARIGYLKGETQRLGALERKGDADVYRREAKVWFELLREAWERAVEEKLFGGVVGRFQPGIQTLRLSSVKVTPEMTAAVERGMTQASAWTHDQAPALGKPPPTANDLTKALGDLEAFSALFKT